MTMTHKERLLRLADVLDTVEPGLLSMGLWRVTPFGAGANITERGAELMRGCLEDATTRDRVRLLQDLIASGHCGFAGCAVGWATQDSVLQAEGLMMDRTMARPVLVQGDETFVDWVAVEDFFGLTPKQAEYLFTVEEYSENRERDEEFGYSDPHPSVVANRLRHFARTNWYGVRA